MQTTYESELFDSLEEQETALLRSYGFSNEQIGRLFEAVGVGMAFRAVNFVREARSTLGEDALRMLTELRDSNPSAWYCMHRFTEMGMEVFFLNDEHVTSTLNAVITLLSDPQYTDLVNVLALHR